MFGTVRCSRDTQVPVSIVPFCWNNNHMCCVLGVEPRGFFVIPPLRKKMRKEERERKSRCDDVHLTVKPAGNQKYKVILGYKLEANLSYTTPCLKIEQGAWKDGSGCLCRGPKFDPSTCVSQLTATSTSSSKGSRTFWTSGLHKHLYLCVHALTETHN